MKTLPEPDFNVQEVLESCAAGLQNKGLARRLMSVLPALEAAEQDYAALGPGARLFEIAPSDDVDGAVSSAEMSTMYKGTLSRQGSRARRFYDRLKTAAPNDICPLCGQRVVKTQYCLFSKFPPHNGARPRWTAEAAWRGPKRCWALAPG
jgi:hypothetical protein